MKLYMKFLDTDKKKKSIWTRDLLSDTRIGRAVEPFLYLAFLGFFLYQGVRGIFYKQALTVGRAGSYTYTGENAQFLGIAYICLVLSFCLGLVLPCWVNDEKILKWTNAYVFILLLLFITSLLFAVIQESF